MLIDVELPQLQCIGETDSSGSEPYLWTDLLLIYQTTSGETGVQDADAAPAPVGAQMIIDHGMKSGDSAPIPSEIGGLATQIPPGLARQELLVVAALFDVKGTPGAAVAAGYNAFLEAVYDQVNSHLLGLASDPTDTAAAIESAVNQAVKNAIEGQLSWLERAGIVLGLDHIDTSIGSDHATYSPPASLNAGVTATAFTLKFDDTKGNVYHANGQWIATVDPCEQNLLDYESAQEALGNVQGALRQLNAKDRLTLEQQQEVERLTKEVFADEAAVANAKAAYEQCRQRNPSKAPNEPPALVGPARPRPVAR
jgi:hypothetical protein